MSMTTAIAFYSYKGGTGRSTALCNVSYTLAERGATVGCVDFDMEAAGLHHIFDVGGNVYSDVGKIQDMLLKDLHEPLELDKHVLDLVDLQYFDRDIDGDLYLIPAGIDAAQMMEIIKTGAVGANSNVFRSFMDEYDLDYLFIDTRSGLSEAAVPSAEVVDLMCLFFRFTRQHKQGTRDAMNFMDILERGQGWAMPALHGVASNIPGSVGGDEVVEYIDDFDKIDDVDVLREEQRLKHDEEVLVANPRQADLEIVDQYRTLADSIETFHKETDS